MPEFEFTQPQIDLIQAKRSIYVEACPGAGKTQAIVQRFVERPLAHPRKGVALLSFTNVATDEARRRCSSEPWLREVPNFIGTIDGFINRFLVGPTFLARRSLAPKFTDNWSSIPHSLVTAQGVPWRASLDWFAIDGESSRLKVDRVPIEQRAAAASLGSHQLESLQARALALWKSFVARGTLSASASRAALRKYLAEDERRQQLGQLMADRFVEVIIDEVQDCSADDLLVLELLRDFGVILVAVGDPDQSIYAFRSDVPADLTPFLDSLGRGSRLNGNFRSTPAICSVVDSLRLGDSTDEPVGPRADSDIPVALVAYRRRAELPAKLAEIGERHGMTREQIVVLAHNSEHARTAAGSSTRGVESTNKLVRLAWAHQVITDATQSSQNRAVAMRLVERTIRELGIESVVQLGHDEYLEACGLTERVFRDECLRIAVAVPNPFEGSPSDFRASLAALRCSQLLLGWTAGGLRSPKGNAWPSTHQAGSSAGCFAHSTIHGIKGSQAAAVALVLPERRQDDDGTQQWCEGRSGEERRVLYVGASRAETLLIVAAHDSIHDLVRRQLEAGRVPLAAEDEIVAKPDGAS